MKKYAALLTPLAALTFNLYASSALAFNPDEYTYRDQSVLIDGQEMAKLRIYNAGQEVIFSKEDLNIDEEEKMKTICWLFSFRVNPAVFSAPPDPSDIYCRSRSP